MASEREDPRRALVLILFASACFAAMAASVKKLPREHVSTLEAVFFRGLVGSVVGFTLHGALRLSFRPSFGVNVIRSVSGGLALLCYYGAVHEHGCELATANLLLKTAPLWVVLLSGPLLGERTHGRARIALLVGLGGAALALGPAPPSERLGIALGLGAGVFSAGAYLSVRWLAHSDHPVSVVTFFATFLVLATAPLALRRFAQTGAPPAGTLALLLGVGVFGTAGQLFMTNAFRHSSAAVVSIAGLAEIAFAALLSMLLFGQHPTWNAAVGGALGVLAGVVASWPAREPGLDQGVPRP